MDIWAKGMRAQIDLTLQHPCRFSQCSSSAIPPSRSFIIFQFPELSRSFAKNVVSVTQTKTPHRAFSECICFGAGKRHLLIELHIRLTSLLNIAENTHFSRSYRPNCASGNFTDISGLRMLKIWLLLW